MVWNCPHCRAALALSDEILGNSWNMSQCPNCENSGFIRRPGNMAIKVDKIPPGEKILVAKFIAKPAAAAAPQKAPVKKTSAPAQAAPRTAATAPGKEPWPVAPLKPVIRKAVPRKAKPALVAAPLVAAQINTVPKDVSDATIILKVEEPTKMVSLKAEEVVPIKVAPPEFTHEILHDSGLIDKTALTRTFEIPKIPMMMAVGVSVKGKKKNKKDAENLEHTKTIEFPEALPDLPPPSSGLPGLLSEISAVVPTIAFLIISGLVGWNAVRYVQGTPESKSHEIVDHLNSHAMAPVRGGRASSKDVYVEKYNDDPTQLRSRTTEVQAYTGPGVDFSPNGILQPGKLYSVLEKDGNWIKFALDKTHAAWVSIAGVDLIH